MQIQEYIRVCALTILQVSDTTYIYSVSPEVFPLPGEEITWDEYCGGGPVFFHFTFYDIDKGDGPSSGDLGVRVEWNITCKLPAN